jgi:hypothetical protein
MDKASRNDTFLVDLRLNDVNVESLASMAVPAITRALDAYRVDLLCPSIVLNDSALLRAVVQASTRDVDGRDTVFRIWQINYWDRELCRRAWNLTSEEVVARLTGSVERASVLHDGAYVVVSKDHLTIPAVEEIDARLRPLLTSEPRIPLGLASLTA